MTDKLADAFVDPIRSIAQEIVRAEIREFREQLQEVCLHAVETAFSNYVKSQAFRAVLRQELPAGGDPGSAVEKYLEEHGAEVLRNEGVQLQLNEVVLEKAKDLLKRSAFSGSLDMKRVVTRIVEGVLEARGITGGGGPDVKAAIAGHLKEHMGSSLSETIGKEVRGFLSSNEMKELLDSKFRAIDLYLKTDLIPKIVKREIAKAHERA